MPAFAFLAKAGTHLPTRVVYNSSNILILEYSNLSIFGYHCSILFL